MPWQSLVRIMLDVIWTSDNDILFSLESACHCSFETQVRWRFLRPVLYIVSFAKRHPVHQLCFLLAMGDGSCQTEKIKLVFVLPVQPATWKARIWFLNSWSSFHIVFEMWTLSTGHIRIQTVQQKIWSTIGKSPRYKIQSATYLTLNFPARQLQNQGIQPHGYKSQGCTWTADCELAWIERLVPSEFKMLWLSLVCLSLSLSPQLRSHLVSLDRHQLWFLYLPRSHSWLLDWGYMDHVGCFASCTGQFLP